MSKIRFVIFGLFSCLVIAEGCKDSDDGANKDLELQTFLIQNSPFTGFFDVICEGNIPLEIAYEFQEDSVNIKSELSERSGLQDGWK